MQPSEFQNSANIIKNLMILAGIFLLMIIIAGAISQGVTSFIPEGTRSCFLVQAVAQDIIGFITAAWITAYCISRKPLDYIGIRTDNRLNTRFFYGVIILYFISIPALNQIIYYNSLIHFPDSLSSVEQWMRDTEDINARVTEILLDTSSVSGLLSGIFVIGVLAGIGEEFLFRGTLQRILTNGGLGQWGIWIAAFIFSAVHLQFYGFVPRLLLGAFFGYLFYTTGSIWPGVFAHVWNNSMVVITAWYANVTGVKFENIDELGVSTQGFPVLASLSLVAVVLFFVYFYKYFFDGTQKRLY